MTRARDRVRGLLAPAFQPAEDRLNARITQVERSIDALKFMVGQQNARTVAHAGEKLTPRQAEFRVFSQWNEDGIIQWLVASLGLTDGRFIEFGVQDYAESNTRFLLAHNNWKGLVIDAGDAHADFLRSSELMWRHDVTAVSTFITSANVNRVFESNGFAGEIELLSIDIDGNDYWVWQAIDVVSPKIVVVEYNPLFGPELAVTIPYDERFDYGAAHFSKLYFGASLAALVQLARVRGYVLVATESHGVNAFFVREDVAGGIDEVSVSDAWVDSRYRSSRDEQGVLSYVSGHRDQLRLIERLPLVEVPSGRTATIAELYAL